MVFVPVNKCYDYLRKVLIVGIQVHGNPFYDIVGVVVTLFILNFYKYIHDNVISNL